MALTALPSTGSHQLQAPWDGPGAHENSQNYAVQTIWLDAEWEELELQKAAEARIMTGWPAEHMRPPATRMTKRPLPRRLGCCSYRSPVPGWSVRDLLCLAFWQLCQGHRQGHRQGHWHTRWNTALLQLLVATPEEIEAIAALLFLEAP